MTITKLQHKKEMDFTVFVAVNQQYHTDWRVTLWNDEFVNSTRNFFIYQKMLKSSWSNPAYESSKSL